MIPQANDNLQEFQVAEAESSRTYKLDFNRQRIADYTDEQEAMVQAIYKILMTERYQYPIYSWNYGVELEALIAKPIPYAIPEIQARITEALMQDDRIRSVDAFSFELGRGTVHVTFTVHTIFGHIQAERTVEI